MLVLNDNIYKGQLAEQGTPTKIESICSIYALHSLGKPSLPFVPGIILPL